MQCPNRAAARFAEALARREGVHRHGAIRKISSGVFASNENSNHFGNWYYQSETISRISACGKSSRDKIRILSTVIREEECTLETKNKTRENAIKSLEAMAKRLLVKADRAAKFNDAASRTKNSNKAAVLKQKIDYLKSTGA